MWPNSDYREEGHLAWPYLLCLLWERELSAAWELCASSIWEEGQGDLASAADPLSWQSPTLAILRENDLRMFHYEVNPLITPLITIEWPGWLLVLVPRAL